MTVNYCLSFQQLVSYFQAGSSGQTAINIAAGATETLTEEEFEEFKKMNLFDISKYDKASVRRKNRRKLYLAEKAGSTVHFEHDELYSTDED